MAINAWTRGVTQVGRRRGFIGALATIQREIERGRRAQARAERQAEVAAQRAAREAEQLAKAVQRAAVADERERKRLYQEARAAEVERLNADLEARLADLESVLAETLGVDDYLDLDALKERFEYPEFDAGALGTPVRKPPSPEVPPPPTGLMARLRPKLVAAHAARVSELRAAYELSLREYQAREEERVEEIEKVRRRYEERREAERQRVEQQHREVEAFERDLEEGAPDAVAGYFGLVLQRSSYPEGFPRHSRVAYVPESRQLVVELDFPPIEIVPTLKQYRYVKARDETTETARPKREIQSLYSSVTAQIALRTIHELLEADRGRWVDTIVFSGFLDAIDPGTGQEIRPCLLSVRTTADAFAGIDLARVDPLACLKTLNASVSSRPTELAPVRPVLEFSMVDPRYIEETDVLSELDQRPNLMELTPTEFESLISNLFERMGLETRQTRPSRDGGVDCVAYDPRPIFGGKVVIQAKRYKRTVGVSAVRDLFGTMQNEGATKGILVTTSGYGKSSFEFADGKPLELLDGANLLYLLAEHAGLEAKIEPPDDWRDPQVDA